MRTLPFVSMESGLEDRNNEPSLLRWWREYESQWSPA